MNSSRQSITSYLALLAAGLLIPFTAFVFFLLSQIDEREEAALRDQSREISRSIAYSVELSLRDMASTLRILATSNSLQNGDLESLHQRTRTALAGSAWNFIAVSREGEQLLNTRVPFGTPLGRTSNITALVLALEQNRVVVSDVFFGETSQRWVFNVVQPLTRPGPGNVAALIMTQNADELAGLLRATPLPTGWTAAILDQSGNLVATTDPLVARQGEPLPFSAETSQTSAERSMIELDGEPIAVGFSELPGLFWQAVVWGPVSTGQASVLGRWQTLLLGGLALSLLSASVVVVLASRLRNSIHGLKAMAQSIGAGLVVSPIRTGIHELDDVSESLTNASFERAQAEEKLILVTRELIHRTKNMLALVQSMIRQSAKSHPATNDLEPVITQRLAGLAQSIDLLTEQGWEGVSLKELIRAQLLPFLAGSDRLTVSGDDIVLKPEAVQNLGLVFHELATNAVKYGSLSTVSGSVRISWVDTAENDDQKFVLRWQEFDGPAPKNLEARRGFGSTILEKHAAAAFNGQVLYQLRPTGLVWQLTTTRETLEWNPSRKLVTASTIRTKPTAEGEVLRKSA